MMNRANDPVAHTDRIEMKCVVRAGHANDSTVYLHVYTYIRIYICSIHI